MDYADLPISADLVARFQRWTEWHDLSSTLDRRQAADWELHSLYAWGLAIDLKRELGEDYYVEYGGREIHDDPAYMRKHFG